MLNINPLNKPEILIKYPELSGFFNNENWEKDINKIFYLINFLVEKNKTNEEEIEEQKQVIESFQTQAQGVQSQLARTRRRPSNLLFNSVSDLELSSSFTEPQPQRFYSPRTPLLSPYDSSASSPIVSSPFLQASQQRFSSIISDLEEIGGEQDQFQDSVAKLITDFRGIEKDLLGSIEKLRNRLNRKDDEIKNWEIKFGELLETNESNEKDIANFQLQVNKHDDELQEREKVIEELSGELKQTNNDFADILEKNEELKNLLNEQSSINKGLINDLDEARQQMNELRQKLDESNQGSINFLEKAVKNYNLEKAEKEELAQKIVEMEKRHQEEKTQRELIYQKQINNLRLFQGSDNEIPNNIPLKKLHRYSFDSYSLPTTRSNSPLPSYSNSNNLFFQLAKADNNYEVNPFEKSFNPHRKASVASPLSQVQNLEDDNSQVWGDILELIDDLGDNDKVSGSTSKKEEPITNEPKSDNITELIEITDEPCALALKEENNLLKTNLDSLEKAWKILHDDNIEIERALQKSTQELFTGTYENQSLKERLGEHQYLLAQSKSQQLELTKKLEDCLAENSRLISEVEALLDEKNTNVMENEKKIQALTAKIEKYQENLKQLRLSTEDVVRKLKETQDELKNVRSSRDNEVDARIQEKKAKEAEDKKVSDELDKTEQAWDNFQAQIEDIQKLLKF